MRHRPRLPGYLRIAFLLLAFTASARAQWLVYELRFKEEEGSVNFSFYSGAYVVAPIGGGAASLIFTTEEGGNRYAVSENSGRFFMAANSGVRKAVISANAINGTAQAFYSASGYLNTSLGYTQDGVLRTERVASELKGRLMAADDESLVSPGADGSQGMIGSATITGKLRTDLCGIVNADAGTSGEAVSLLVDLLEQYGYRLDVDDLPVEEGGEPVVPADTGVPAPAGTGDGGIDPSLFPPGSAEDLAREFETQGD